MPPELIAFLRFRQDYLHQFNPTQDLTNSPCPRTWANAGSLIKLNLPNEIEYHAYAGAVGEPAAAELTGFLRIYRQMPSLEAILADPDKATIPSDPAVLYAISVGLAAKANPNNFARVTKYAQRLLDGGHGEHGVLLIRDAIRRKPEVQHTQAFIKMVSTTEIGKLFSGSH